MTDDSKFHAVRNRYAAIRPAAFRDGTQTNALAQQADRIAIEQGYERGTDSYFSVVDHFLGVPNEQVENSQPGSLVSVNADGTASVTLEPRQREIAKISGISEKDYAENLLKLHEMKRAGMYQE